MLPVKPHFERIKNASEYLYFSRFWLDGNVSDVVIFWQDDCNVYRRYCEAYGNPIFLPADRSAIRPIIVRDDVIESSLFEKMMRFSIDHGVLDACTPKTQRSTLHVWDFYEVKTADNHSNSFCVAGGLMPDNQYDRIREIFLGEEGLGQSYKSLLNLDNESENDEA